MAFNRPTLTAIIDRILSDITSRFQIAGSVLRRSVLGIIGRALAGAAHELYGYISYLARQIIIDTADAGYLERWASVWGISRKAAAYASGIVNFSGVNGSVIPSGTILQRQDGARFQTTASGTIASGVAAVPVIAVAAGAAGNTLAAVVISLVQPVSGVLSSATVATDGLSNGSDVESDDALRARLLFRIQDPPQGGDADDYVKWALEVPGVTRAWISPLEQGLGTVTIRFVRDGDGDIIPSSPEIAAVFNHIELLRPVTAEIFVVAPTNVPIDFSIQIAPNTAAVQAAVTAELADLIRRTGEPDGTVLFSQMNEAVSISAGETDHVITSPIGNYDLGPGEIATLGAIIFSDIP